MSCPRTPLCVPTEAAGRHVTTFIQFYISAGITEFVAVKKRWGLRAAFSQTLVCVWSLEKAPFGLEFL